VTIPNENALFVKTYSLYGSSNPCGSVDTGLTYDVDVDFSYDFTAGEITNTKGTRGRVHLTAD
jgi:hypothetical protein